MYIYLSKDYIALIHSATKQLKKKTFTFTDVSRLVFGRMSNSTLSIYLNACYEKTKIASLHRSIYVYADLDVLLKRRNERIAAACEFKQLSSLVGNELKYRLLAPIYEAAKSLNEEYFVPGEIYPLVPHITDKKTVRRYLAMMFPVQTNICKGGCPIYKFVDNTEILNMAFPDAMQMKPIRIPELKVRRPTMITIDTDSAQNIIDAFIAMSNADKARLVATLIPVFTEAELMVKFEELYPNYLLPDVKSGDTIFHPIAGDVKIESASNKYLKFYANGNEWLSDRNGYLIINGKPQDKRTLFTGLDDYVSYMKGMGK